MTTYSDLQIQSLDLDFIEKLSESLDLDYTSIEIDVNWDITNQIIYWLYETYINNLDLPSYAKTELIDSIYTNYIDSWLDIDIQEFIKDNELEEFKEELERLD